MPILMIVTAAAQIMFALHAARTRRPQYWFYVILFMPVAGMAAYVLLELLPEALHSRGGARAVEDARRLVNPEGAYRELAAQLALAPTVRNLQALAEECVRLGRLEEAEPLYRRALDGIHATAPHLMLALAQVQFARGDAGGTLDTLSALRAANPDFQSADGHLLVARALEGLGRDGEALAEYEALTRYFPGEEARVRHGLLLQKSGEVAAARRRFEEVKQSVDSAPAFYRRSQREWYQVAERNLRG